MREFGDQALASPQLEGEKGEKVCREGGLGGLALIWVWGRSYWTFVRTVYMGIRSTDREAFRRRCLCATMYQENGAKRWPDNAHRSWAKRRTVATYDSVV